MEEFNNADVPSTDYDYTKTVELAGGDEKVAKQLTGMLADSLDEALSNIAQLQKESNFDAIQKEAHKLHGGLCYLSAPKLLYLVQHLEYACKINNTDLASRIIPLFTSAAEKLKFHCK